MCVHGLAALSSFGGPGPRGPRSRLAARDYRDVTLSLWPPWTGIPREPHSPTSRCTSPCHHRAPLAPCVFFLILPIHGPLCLLEPTGRRGAFAIAGLGSPSAFDSASSLYPPAKEVAASFYSPVRKPDAALLGSPNHRAEQGIRRERGNQVPEDPLLWPSRPLDTRMVAHPR